MEHKGDATGTGCKVGEETTFTTTDRLVTIVSNESLLLKKHAVSTIII